MYGAQRILWASMVAVLMGGIALADEVVLDDGSRIMGQVQSVSDGKLMVLTDFAGVISIDMGRVQGVSTDQPLTVELKSGDRAVGSLEYTPGVGQRIGTGALGGVTVDMGDVSAVWSVDESGPVVAALKEKLKNARTPWSLSIELGLDGQSGNTDRTSINGRVEAKRTTDSERLTLYSQGRFSKENGQDTVKEIIGGLSLEVDLDEKWFVFGKTELEFDKFENLDLRATVTGGLGYTVFSKPDHEWKLRGGLGFQHESFDTGVSEDQAVAELGWDYRIDISPWMQFTHHITYYPTFDDVGDYRLVVENAAEFPLNPDKDWRFRIGVRNNYVADPQPGIRGLDNYYFFNIVWATK